MNTEQNQNTENNKSIKNEPRFLGVIEGYINTEWQPTRAFSPNDRRFRIISSQEIVTDLAEMVDIELNDVAAAMMHLGYRTIVVDGKVGWLLEYRAK